MDRANNIVEHLADEIKINSQMSEKMKLTCSFKKYIETFHDINDDALKIDFSGIFKKKIYELFSNELNFKFDEAFYKCPLISYADHHGLLNYNLLYNSNILLQKFYLQKSLTSFIVLSVGNVPLNNISYPRGFYFKNRKFNFFPLSKSKTPVSLFKNSIRVLDNSDISGFITSYDKSDLTSEESFFLKYLFFDKLGIEELSENYSLFSDQVSVLNFRLWKLFFDKTIRDSIPELIYLQSNDIVNSIFLDFLEDENSLISRILFDAKTREIYLRNFCGIQGCWGYNSGSHFFIGLTTTNRIDCLYYDKNKNCLIGKDNLIFLEKNNIRDLLLKKQISLSLFFDFLILTFLGGYITLGGFNQIEYLPQMQRAHVKSLREIGENDLADDFESRITDGLICGMTPLKHGSAIDMIWHYNSVNGKFNGNLDRGLTSDELQKIYSMPVRDMILAAAETMAGIVK